MVCRIITFSEQLEANGHWGVGQEKQVKGLSVHCPSTAFLQSRGESDQWEKWNIEAGSPEPEVDLGQADKMASGSLEATLLLF